MMGLLALFKRKEPKPLPPWGKGKGCRHRMGEGRFNWCFLEMRPRFVVATVGGTRGVWVIWRCPEGHVGYEERSTHEQASAWGFVLPQDEQEAQDGR